MKPHEIEAVLLRDVREKEFCQTVKNFLASLVPVLSRNPQYQNQAIIERLIEPERIITFRVPWTDDSGRIPGQNGPAGRRCHALRLQMQWHRWG